MMPRLTHLAGVILTDEGDAAKCFTPWPFVLSFTRLELDLMSVCCDVWLFKVEGDEPGLVACGECGATLNLPRLIAEWEEVDCFWRDRLEWTEALLSHFEDPLTAVLRAHEVVEELDAIRAHFVEAGVWNG